MKRRYTNSCISLVVLIYLTSGISFGQVQIILEKVPANTPKRDTLFLAGNFNNWNPHDPSAAFIPQPDGTYAVAISTQQNPLTCKVTRGTWASVEGDSFGKKLGDRSFAWQAATPIELNVRSWEDLAQFHCWTIIVEKIPENTPHGAPVFVAGNFNNWKAGDENFRLIPDPATGKSVIRIPKTTDTLYYKLNRGDWSAVACRAHGRTMYNRLSTWMTAQAS